MDRTRPWMEVGEGDPNAYPIQSEKLINATWPKVEKILATFQSPRVGHVDVVCACTGAQERLWERSPLLGVKEHLSETCVMQTQGWERGAAA